MTQEEILNLNLVQSLFFLEKDRIVIYIPPNWPREPGPFGPDGENVDSIYAWGSASTISNSDDISTFWYPLSYLSQLPVVSELTARRAHPNLFNYLQKIDSGEIR